MADDIRWKQRYTNFTRAVSLLDKALVNGPGALSDLEREGVIQRFEYSFELCWKTLKDYLEGSGVNITPVTPRQVIKEAVAAGLLSDGKVWIDMLDRRNLLSHTYDAAVFEESVKEIAATHLGALLAARDWLKGRLSE